MAYISQEEKSKLAPGIKAVLKKFGLKGTISVRNHMSLVLTVKSGKIDFVENYISTNAAKHYGQPMSTDQIKNIRRDSCLDINTYWAHEHYSGDAKEFLAEAIAALKGPDYFDHSDAQTDYFNTSHYIDINIGRYNKPYVVTQ